jgi:NTE family protein
MGAHLEAGVQTFADLAVDLKVIASDLLTEKEYVLSRASTPGAPISLAARASASIPIVFAPVVYKDVLCVDGWCADNLPAGKLTVDGVPRIGIYLESDDPPLLPGAYGLKTLAPRIIDLLLASNEASHIALDDRSCADGLREFARSQHADGDPTTPLRRRLRSGKSIARSDGRGVVIDGLKRGVNSEIRFSVPNITMRKGANCVGD